MPPKKAAVSKKAVDKVAAKVIEDRTFGLKNKNKSKKVQAYVESVTKQAKQNAIQKFAAPKTAEQIKAEQAKKAKEAAAAAEKELAALFKSAIKQPKLDAGVDPKSVLCEYFKAGVCDKGDKCKFSHDLAVGRKAAKIDLHTDRRDEDKADGMENWDQDKLEAVVKTKHGAEKLANKTDIVCKYFLEAIEKELYGWFWVCPNGGDACKYKHALPPGYVYKSKAQRELETAMKAEAAANEVSMEEQIEEERRALGTDGLTPVTAETFAVWKEERAKRKAAELEAKRVEEAKKTGTKGYNVLSGRALFSYDPSLFVDDEAADNDVYSDHGDEALADRGTETTPVAGIGAGLDAGPIDESIYLDDAAAPDDMEEDGEESEEDSPEEDEEDSPEDEADAAESAVIDSADGKMA